MMKIKYYDRINKEEIEIEVNSKVKHYLDEYEQEEKQKHEQEKEIGILSLDQLMEDGFQPALNTTVEEQLIRQYKERKYLNSPEYKKFRKELRDEIRRVMDIMPDYLKQVMFLRFFRDLSISKIAELLNFSKSTAQSYISRGCAYIKDFLEKDIEEQKKKEKEAKEKRARQRAKRLEELKKNLKR